MMKKHLEISGIRKWLLPLFVGVSCLSAGWSAEPAHAAAGQIGMNFWFRVDWGENGNNKVWKSGANFSTDDNPFNQTFLDEIEPYSTLRMMEWNPTNYSGQVNWDDRRKKWESPQEGNPGEPNTQSPTKGVAYEWQIKLCNLKNANYWVNLPHKATDDYVRQLARLIRDNLNPNLKVYVEYSNEVWFDPRDSSGNRANNYATVYSEQQGASRGLAGQLGNVSGPNDEMKNRQGYYVLRSLQIFKIFNEEFGSNSGRVKKVLAGLVHDGWNMQIWQSALNNVALNPNNLKPDYVATSLYPGTGLNGADPNALQQLYDDEAAGFTNYIKKAKSNATSYFGVPLAIYEAGYGITNNANVLGASSSLYDWQKKLLTDLASQCDLVMLYCHTTPYDQYKAFGLKSYIGQPASEAHRYRATVDWINANGGNGKGSSSAPIPPTNDSVSNLSAPLIVSPGQTVTTTVSYTATSTRKLKVMLQDASTYAWYGGTDVNVSAGSATINVNVSVLSSTPPGSNYIWQAHLFDTTGNYIAGTRITGVTVTNGSGPGGRFAQVATDGRYYAGNLCQYVNVSPNTTYTASINVKGSGAVMLRVLPTNWSYNINSVRCDATSSWKQYSFTFNSGSNSQVVFSLDDAYATTGTVQIDNCVLAASGNTTNLLANPGYESGTSNWYIRAPFSVP